jgi:hypothetical protein
MKIYNIQQFKLNFTGKREDRKTVSQLKKDNSYDLNAINQRKISNAIDNLAKNSGEENVKFLIDVSENLKYGTNIDLGKSGYNDWKVKLSNAAKQSLANSSKEIQEKYGSRVDKLTQKKNLTPDEKEILNLRKNILKSINKEDIKKIQNKNIKNINNNLDYFIISTEIPSAQKLYILKRLNYFMSPEYEINPQLADKKTQALAEIINDLVVDTPESKIPNIKSVNQKGIGSCGAISICRKALAYEDKPNFVDIILSELDNSDYIQVYDITKLGTHTKIPVNKISLDFEYALSKGYRIIDTSALYWMNIADMAGSANEFVKMYSSFDKTYFDTFQDSHLTPDLDEDKVKDQDYYRALIKAKDALKTCKTNDIKQKYIQNKNNDTQKERLEISEKYMRNLEKTIKDIAPNFSNHQVRTLISDIKSLELQFSYETKKLPEYKQKYSFLSAETENAKIKKVQQYLINTIPNADAKKIEKDSPEILRTINEINGLTQRSSGSYAGQQYSRMSRLYNAAASYRIQRVFNLEIEENKESELRTLNLPDRETIIIKNLNSLIKKLEQGTLNPKIKEVLAANFDTENTDEALREALINNKESLEYALTDILDNLYNSCLSVDRKTNLSKELKEIKETIKDFNDKNFLEKMASNLHVKNDKRQVLNILDRYIEKLDSKNCSEQDYINIYNHVGKKNQMQDFKELYEKLSDALFNPEEANPKVIAGFNLINGLPQDAPIKDTMKVFNQIGEYFNQISILTTSYQQALEIHNEDDEILNSALPEILILKTLENKKEIIPEKDLRAIQYRLNKIEEAKTSYNGERIFLKDLPKDLTIPTKQEKETLDSIEKNINKWYAQTSRALDKQYKMMRPTLDVLHQNIGIMTGQKWVNADGSGGLIDSQEVKIIEHMTDRPYYTEGNIKEAVEKIKNSPYSGISLTSVNSKEPAYHAQYIADIAPIEVITPNGKETKEALFHDNTWGAAEKENVWKDENGLLRTDYSNGYGGDLGYITNDKYRNGNLLENIYGSTGEANSEYINNKAYKKLTHIKSPDSFTFAMFENIITPGKHPKANTYVRNIREHILLSPIKFFDQLEEQAQTMTRAEILNVIDRTNTLGYDTYNKYIDIENRILGNKILNSGIKTKEDYDKLERSDELKILFEKIALIKSYNQIPNDKIFYRKTSLKELAEIKKEIKLEARKNFDYIFDKNIDIAKYGAESIQDEVYQLLDDFQRTSHVKITPANMGKIVSSLEQIKSKYGAASLQEDIDDLIEEIEKTKPIKITATKKFKIANSLEKVKKDEFDGSLDKTIDLMANNFKQTLTKNTVGFENKEIKIQELTDKIKSLLHEKMEFNQDDLEKMSNGNEFSQNIVKWIDEIYDPTTDKEFVQIFKNIQNMTTKEFNEKFNSKISDELIGIKNITGYDILKDFRAADEKTKDLVFNTLFNEDFGYQIRLSKTIPQYGYNKLDRNLQGIIYKDDKRSFDDIYLDYYYNLMLINIHKKYDNFKLEAFNRYKMFPAVPQVEIEDEDEIVNIFQNLYSEISDSIDTINNFKECNKTFEIMDKINIYLNKFNENQTPTPAQQKYIKSVINKFLKISDDAKEIQNSIDAATALLQLPKTAHIKEYKAFTQAISNEINQYKTSLSGETLDEKIQEELEKINQKKREFIMNSIDPKYQKDAYEILNKWISAKIKNSQDEVFMFAEIEDFYNKHKVIKSPEKMLNDYLLLLAKPSGNEHNRPTAETEQLKDVKTVYRHNLMGLLTLSNLINIQYDLMKCAKEGNLNIVKDEFKNSKVELNNGDIINLGSDKGLNLIMAELLANEEINTAEMFLEQLGLGEEYIESVTNNKTFFDSAYKNIKRINNIYTAVDRQTKIIKDEFDNLPDINNDPDYIEKLDKMEARIIEKCKHTAFRKTIPAIKVAFKEIKKDIKNNPDYDSNKIVELYINTIKEGSIILANQEISNCNKYLKQYQVIFNLITKIKLPLNSPYEAKREEAIAKYKEIENFVSTNAKYYKNIDISTQPSS